MIINKLSDMDLFYIRLKRGWISNNKKQLLYELVKDLEQATQIQKERFILAYSLNPTSIEKYNLSNIAKEQNCSPSAIRYSIGRIKNFLANLEDEKKQIFSEIIKDNDYFNQERSNLWK